MFVTKFSLVLEMRGRVLCFRMVDETEIKFNALSICLSSKAVVWGKCVEFLS